MFMWNEILPLPCLQHILLLLTRMLKTCYRIYLKGKCHMMYCHQNLINPNDNIKCAVWYDAKSTSMPFSHLLHGFTVTLKVKLFLNVLSCILLFLSSISLVESSVLLYVTHILQYKHRNSTIRNVYKNQAKSPFY